ncbi:hypothetical protein [uncultured Wocania sp.]|uniref:hypothetical protein n=1 Tax=uncultured Wocania sp. TaxID=2834404 RepID=UPI0030F66FF9
MNKPFLALIILILSFVSCNNDNDDFNTIDSDTRWWILTRPNNNNIGESEIILYNETKSIIERTIDLPTQADSPHALEFDGEFLWLGGMGGNESIYKLNPEDGTVVSELTSIRTEGISYLNGELYYSFYGKIYQISQNGTLIQEITLSTNNNPSDIAINNSSLYYVYNGTIDPIIKINQTDSTEETIAETEVTALYTLAIHNDNLIVTTNSNAIRRFDISSGKRISDTETIIEGWITAIVPHNKQSE